MDSKGKVTIKGIGKTTITIKAAETDTYSAATKKITLTIKPKKAAGVALTAKRKAIAVSWDKDSKVSGYQILCATNSKFTKGKKTVTVKNAKTTKKTVSKLKAKKTYYVKVRAYKTVSGKKVYGAYSAVKKIKTR
ncbi:MAG: fibronectin type III domain-containing protein [Firmicutes bacterium]|nr:fibronectin type III domain-containing protein [Bacillota bacterium]NBI63346.1 fibronectin type III domain-containing protein [Clostridiales bacterium]